MGDMAVDCWDVREQGLAGKLFLPHVGNRLPAVVVLGGSRGGLREYEASLLASHGFAALALRYFGVDGLPVSLLHLPLEYFHTAIEWLQRQPRCNGNSVGIVGVSRGGELALLLGATYAEIGVVVGFGPSGVICEGIIKRPFDQLTHPWFWLPGSGRGWRWGRKAPWTLHGRPLPYVQPALRYEIRAVLRYGRRPAVPNAQIHVAAMRDMAAIHHAMIAVEQINGPVLLFSGERDEVWPSSFLSRMMMQRLTEHRHPFSDEHTRYPDAGHVFPDDAYRDAWSRTIQLLRRRLSETPL